MIFRDICRTFLPRFPPRPPPPPHYRLRRCIRKRSRPELDNLDIARHVLATSMRGFHSSFRIFSIRPASLPSHLLCRPDFLLSPRASLVAALTHHLLYIALVETPDIIFDILFCRRRSSDREATRKGKRRRKEGGEKKKSEQQRSCIRGGLKIGEVVARGVVTDEIDGFAKRDHRSFRS